MKAELNNIGPLFRIYREVREKTQMEIATLAGLTVGTVVSLEENSNACRVDTIMKVAKALRVEINFDIKTRNHWPELAQKLQLEEGLENETNELTKTQ